MIILNEDHEEFTEAANGKMQEGMSGIVVGALTFFGILLGLFLGWLLW